MASIPIPEEQPLLRNELSPAPPSATLHSHSQDQSTPSSSHLHRKQFIRLHVCAYATFTLTGFAGMLLDVPLERLLERAACQDYYLKHPSWPLHERSQPLFQCHWRDALQTGTDPKLSCNSAWWENGFRCWCTFVHSNSRSAPDDCFGLWIHEWLGLLMAIVFGSRADKHGWKPVLMISFKGELTALLWVAAICKTPPSPV